ncbi:MAG: hypothetical protein AB4426_23805 [Xenococcaceae cyanobacterium]
MSQRKSKRSPAKSQGKSTGHSVANILTLPESERKLVNWIRRQGKCTLLEVAAQIGEDETAARTLLDTLEEKGFLQKRLVAGDFSYQICLVTKQGGKPSGEILQAFEKKFGKLKFSTLILLTFVTVALLTPFALSPLYLPILRDKAFKLHQLLQGDIYKQITGYTSLAFVLFEMLLTARKRGRGWKIKLNIPGSIQLWRSLHIFLGVTLLGVTLIHTVGATGLNFNAIFLRVFFGVILSALVGIVAETGVLESPRKYFGAHPTKANGLAKMLPTIKKGPLIRRLRDIWLSTHIFLVSVFFVLLGFHIFLAYYYQ